MVEAYFYYAWMIPSAISFCLSFCVLINILYFRELRSRIYQQLLAVIAITDLIKCFSWLIGNKYEASRVQCEVQEYLFQTGSEAQGLSTAMVCAVALYTVRQRVVPPRAAIYTLGMSLLLILIVSISCSIHFGTALYFCGINGIDDLYADKTHTSNRSITFFSTFGFIIPLCVILDLVLLLFITHELKQMDLPKEKNSGIWILAHRLKAFPLIFVTCFTLNIITMLILLIQDRFLIELNIPVSIMMSSTGTLISANYFYHQTIVAPFLVWSNWRICFSERDTEFQDTHTLVEVVATMSHVPQGHLKETIRRSSMGFEVTEEQEMNSEDTYINCG